MTKMCSKTALVQQARNWMKMLSW